MAQKPWIASIPGTTHMGPDGGFSTGSDVLMDGGVTAACGYGDLAHKPWPVA